MDAGGATMRNGAQYAGGSSRTMRMLALGGVAGPLLFVAIVVAGGLLHGDYSHVSQTISELGEDGAEYAALQNFNFIMLGAVVLGFSWALASVIGGSRLGPALVGFFGLSSLIANGLLPCDPGCEGQTTVALLHIVTAIAGFLAALAGMFVLARRWQGEPEWRSHGSFTRGAAFVTLAGLAAFIVTQAAEVESVDGLVQRIFVATLLTWIVVTAARLYRAAARAEA